MAYQQRNTARQDRGYGDRNYGDDRGGYGNRGGFQSRDSYQDRPQREPRQPVVTGQPEEVTVKWYNPEKGFGFVTTDNGDLFLHASAIKAAGRETVNENQKMTIRRGPGRKPNSEAVAVVDQFHD